MKTSRRGAGRGCILYGWEEDIWLRPEGSKANQCKPKSASTVEPPPPPTKQTEMLMARLLSTCLVTSCLSCVITLKNLDTTFFFFLIKLSGNEPYFLVTTEIVSGFQNTLCSGISPVLSRVPGLCALGIQLKR